MFRAASLLLLLFSGWSFADDLPPPMTEKERARIVEQYQKEFARRVDGYRSAMSDAETMMQYPFTLQQGKLAYAEAKTKLAAIAKNHYDVGGVFKNIGENPTTGQVGPMAQPSLIAKSVSADGVLVEGILSMTRYLGGNGFNVATTEDQVIVRYLLADAGEVKKGARLKMVGLWYVAGTVERNGRKVPVLYQFKIKPKEVPRLSEAKK